MSNRLTNAAWSFLKQALFICFFYFSLGFQLPNGESLLDLDYQNMSMTSDLEPTYKFHSAASRGHVNHGWLDTFHSFSFASWHDAQRMHFGALRVLNDDFVEGGGAFAKHPHDNMEIVSIPLEGDLEHEDSMGNHSVIREGDVQIMSAGKGIVHSEKNHSTKEAVRFLQIWVFPNERDLVPEYDQQHFTEEEMKNSLRCIVSPTGDQNVKIHQNAYFHMGNWDKQHEEIYQLHGSGQGVYVFLLEGELSVDGRMMNRRDGMGISGKSSIQLKAQEDSKVLLIEIPMKW